MTLLNSRSVRLAQSVSILCFVASVLAGCGQKDIFQAPPRETPPDQVANPSTLSTLTFVTGLSYESIRKIIQTQTPAQVSLSGSGHVACGQIPYIKAGGIESREKCAQVPYCDIGLTSQKCGTRRQCVPLPDTLHPPSIGTSEQCADYNWTAVATRQGEAAVRQSGESLHLEMPIQVNGKAGLSGDLAKLLSLSAKSFEAQLRPGVDVSVALGADWCPKLTVAPTNHWVTSAVVEAVGRSCLGFDLGPLGYPEVCAGPANIDLTSQANDAVVALQANLITAANSAINCNSIRDTVATQWRAVAIQLPSEALTGRPLYLNITPKGFAFSGLRAADDSVKVALKVWAETKIDPAPISTDPIPLPDVSPLDASGSRLSVSVAATVPYADIAAALGKGLRDKDFTSEPSSGKVRVRIKDFEIYPTSKGLALGLQISAELPGQILNTKGWVYLIGRPQATMTGSAIEISDIGYATVLDNRLWQLLVGVFDSQIMEALRSNARIELKPAISKSAEQLVAQINSASIKGMSVVAAVPTANLEEIHIGADSLVGRVSVNMDFLMQPNLEDLTK